LGIYIGKRIEIYRTHYVHKREVHKINTYSIKVCKKELGLRHEALYTVYKGAILPLLLYGAPLWIESLENECNKTVYSRYQDESNST